MMNHCTSMRLEPAALSGVTWPRSRVAKPTGLIVTDRSVSGCRWK